MYISEVVSFFSHLVLIQSTQFFSGVTVRSYKIHVLIQAFFFLTIRMPIISRLDRMVTHHDDLTTIDLHDASMKWPCEVR